MSASRELQSAARRHNPASTMLAAEREQALIASARRGDREAAGELVLAHVGLVYTIARRITPTPCEDAIAEGVVALLEALGRFDPARNTRFSTYAGHWIRARVQRFVLANRGIVGSPDTRAARRVFARIGRTSRALSTQSGDPRPDEIAAALGVTSADVEGVMQALHPHDVPVGSSEEPGQHEPTSPEGTPEERVGARELTDVRRRVVDEALAALPVRERVVVERRAYAETACTLDQLAVELSLSRERVRQLEVRALERIGKLLVRRGLAA